VALLQSGRLLDSIAEMDKADVILQVGGDLERTHPVYSLRVRKAVRNHGARLFMATTAHGGLDQEASWRHSLEAGGELAFLGGLVAGGGEDANLRLRDHLIAAKHGILIVNAGAGNDSLLDAAMEILSRNTAGLRLLLLDDGPNQVGAWDAGFASGYFPGYVPVQAASAGERRADWGDKVPAEAGLSRKRVLAAIGSGELQGVLLFNSGRPWNWGADILEAVTKARTRLVFDLLPGPAADAADFLFPSPSMAEVDGTMTTPDHRIVLLRRAVPGPERLWHPASVLARIEKIMTGRSRSGAPVDVFRDLTRAGAGYENLNYGLLRPEGRPWQPARAAAESRAGGGGS
jgi:predicted molibdopterin-dependent oxidoreductase YjgC